MKNILLALLFLISMSTLSYAQTYIPYSYPVYQPVVTNMVYQPAPLVTLVPPNPIVTIVPVPTIVQPVIVHQPVVVMQKRFCCLPWFNEYYYGSVSPPVIRY